MKKMANSVKDELEQELKIEQLHSDLKNAESQGFKEPFSRVTGFNRST